MQFDDKIVIDGHELILNGLGLRKATFLKLRIYVAALYLLEPDADGHAIVDKQQLKRITLKMLRGVHRNDLNKAIEKGFRENHRGDIAELQTPIAEFKALVPDLRKGDEISYTYLPGVGIELSLPDKVLGVVESIDFADTLFRLWLGDKPANLPLREGMLGAFCH